MILRDIRGLGRLLVLSARILIPHSVAATLTEVVFREKGFHFGWFYALVEFVTYAACAGIHQLLRWRMQTGFAPPAGKGCESRDAARGYLICGASMTLSHGAGAAALVHLNYTAAMLFKSGKVPSILLGASLFKLQKASLEEVCWAIVMMAGLFSFAVGEKLESLRFDALGLLLITVNLVGGSATANLQQLLLTRGTKSKDDPDNVEELLFFQYSAAALIMLIFCAISGELRQGLAWYANASWTPWAATLADNVLSYLGLLSIMQITSEWDATRANVVCSCRKVITFAVSYILFPKSFSVFHGVGFLLTVMGGVRLQLIKLQATAHKE